MIQMKLRLLASCFAMLISGAVYGQTAPTPPTPAQIAAHQVSFLTQVLSLTTEQQAQATTIFTTEATAEASLRTSTQTAHKGLETAIEANDSAGIATAAASIGQLTTQEVQAHATAQAAFWQILTADQQTKAKALHTRGGPGGFGHPGMHGGPDMGPPPGAPGE
jgi:Spy/CpxP family protein refolding chaperone